MRKRSWIATFGLLVACNEAPTFHERSPEPPAAQASGGLLLTRSIEAEEEFLLPLRLSGQGVVALQVDLMVDPEVLELCEASSRPVAGVNKELTVQPRGAGAVRATVFGLGLDDMPGALGEVCFRGLRKAEVATVTAEGVVLVDRQGNKLAGHVDGAAFVVGKAGVQ